MTFSSLTKCYNLPFILALNPGETLSNLVVCPKLEKLILPVKAEGRFHITDMLNMTKERARKGAKLSSITFVGLGDLASRKEVFKLREHVAHIYYTVDDGARVV